MRPHHTKDKGDNRSRSRDCGPRRPGLRRADRVVRTRTVRSRGLPRDDTFMRVQVKYRTLSSKGSITMNFESSWSDSKGSYHRPLDKQEVDVVSSTPQRAGLVTTSTRRPSGPR